MPTTEPKVDAYIGASALFAQPILTHLRDLVHQACPACKEAIKWSTPHFEYNGSNLCSMAAFKQHCAFTFWLGARLNDTHKIFKNAAEKNAMGQLGPIKTLHDLPPDEVLISYLKEAMALIDSGEKLIRAPAKAITSVAIPQQLQDALQQHPAAAEIFEKMSNSHKKEYAEWIAEAKTDTTRNKRLATTIEWLTEGKHRHWKYQK